jgi:hypothetical protein
LVYVVVQQSLRQSANDPQIQMAEDAAAALARGQDAASIVPESQVDLGRSLAPFLMLFDDAGQVIGTSGLLHGQPPVLPSGVLAYAGQNGEDRVTWQPEAGVRIATVIVHSGGPNGGFALAGRSLREVEEREAQVELEAGAGLVLLLAGTLFVVALSEVALGGKERAG